MLSELERDYLNSLISGKELKSGEGKKSTPQQKNKLRKNMMKKLTEAIPDLALIFNQKTLFYKWMTGEGKIKGRTVSNLNLWTGFQNALLGLPFRNGPGAEFPYVFKAGKFGKGSLGYWYEDLGLGTRRYRVAVINGDTWQPDFPFRGLSRRAAMAIREAIDLGLSIPKGRESAISRRELGLLVARKRQSSPS